ncbi:MAG: hypothetical protein ACOVOX_16465, partial [Burkholderiaceae bacterium]
VEVPGYRFGMAVSLLRLLQQARQNEAHGLSLEQMATTMRVDPLQIEPILESLVQLDWVGRLDEEGSVRHVLLCDPTHVLAAPMLRLMLLQPSGASQTLWERWGAERLLLADLLKD